MRKAILSAAVMIAGVTGQTVQCATPKEVLRPEGFQRNLPVSPGIAVGDLVFVSGQGSRDPKTGQHPASYDATVRQVIENVRSVLEVKGMGLRNAISCHAYLTT